MFTDMIIDMIACIATIIVFMAIMINIHVYCFYCDH